MKTTLLFLFWACHLGLSAQWTLDPANPQLVCDELNYQNGPQSYPDGEGGAYILWADNRNNFNKKEVYGQHISATGTKLWEPEGRLILTDTKNIEWFRFIRYGDGKMIVCWYPAAGGVANPDDKLWFQELNEQGQKVWANDLAVSEEDPNGALSVGYFINAIIKRDAAGFQVCMMILTYGYDRIRMTRISEDGNLLMPYNGVEIGPLDIGNVSMTGDGGTGAYVYYSEGNGAGAGLRCMHVDQQAGLLWPEWVSVAGPNGLSYQFSAIGDEAGVVLVWQGTGLTTQDIFARRLNSDGSYAWNGNALNICTAPGNQINFTWIKSGNDYYISWSDGRPGLVGYYGIYAQKFNISGNILWQQDGVQVANLNTYDPYSRITKTPDGEIYISHQSTVYGYVIQKLSSDGIVQWDQDGYQIATNTFNPNATERAEFISGNNFLAVWVTPLTAGGTDKIYVSRIADLSPVQYVDEFVTACGEYVYESTTYNESGIYQIDLGDNTILNLHVTILENSAATINEIACNVFDLNGTTYDQSGAYVQVLPNAAGCDSTIYLNLTIVEMSDHVSISGNTLTADQDGLEYQWTDCETGEGVGEGLQSFTATESGSYQVIVAGEFCDVTSECVEVIVGGIQSEILNDLKIFPTAVTDRISVLNVRAGEQHEYTIYDMCGKSILSGMVKENQNDIQVSGFSSGCYIIVLRNGHEISDFKFVKL